MMVSDHINYLTFEDPGAVHTVRRALKLAEAGDLYGAAETAGVDVAHAAVVSQGLRRGMRFSIGAEVDNDPRARPDAQNIVDAMRPDGLIRSVHFLSIDHPEKGPDWQWAFDNPDFRDLYDVIGTDRVWELYMAKLLDDIEKLPGHIVGHFYVPANFGNWPDDSKMERYEDQLLDACAARGMAVEINTRYLYRENLDELKEQYRTANMRLMRKAKAKGVGIAVGSDAHSPKDQGNGFAEVLKMLDEAEINELVFPVNGRLARVALRATKEHLQKVKSQEPVAQPGSSISGFSRAELGLPERNEAEEREAAAAAAPSKTGHDTGPRKRASGPARATKKPAKETSERETKAERAAKPEPEVEATPEPAPKPEPKAKAAKAKAAEPKTKPEPKPQTKPAAKAKPAVKPSKVPAKAAAKPAAKPVGKAAAKASAKAVKAVKPAPKAATQAAPAKKAPAKKAAAKPGAAKPGAAKKVASAKKAAPKKATAGKKSAAKKTPAAAKRKVSTPKRAATKKTSTKRR
jgi:HisJ family histidinol phosphate phosphatase